MKFVLIISYFSSLSLSHTHTYTIPVALDEQADQINPYYVLSEQDEHAVVAFPNLVLIHWATNLLTLSLLHIAERKYLLLWHN